MRILNGYTGDFSTLQIDAAEKNEENKVLIKQAKSGDSAAFGTLYEQISHELFRYAVYITGSPEDAEDAVQETLINAWKNIRSLRETDKFRGWIFRILLNECKHINRKKLQSVDTVSLEDYENYLPDPDKGYSITGGDIVRTVKSLPPPDGQIVMMSVIGGFNSTELAKIFEMTPEAVRTRLSRSMKRLRKILSEVKR